MTALEPFVGSQTVDIHYNKHHQTYVDKLNTAIEQTQPELFEKSLIEVLKNLETLVKADIQKPVYNNGWQVVNHDFFWESLTPESTKEPIGEVAQKINNTFGDFESFKEKFTTTSVNQFGSGWAWLILNQDKELEIVSTSNADNPTKNGSSVLLVIDVWEHAYYLNYQNRRPDFVKAFWEIVNWQKVEERYQSIK